MVGCPKRSRAGKGIIHALGWWVICLLFFPASGAAEKTKKQPGEEIFKADFVPLIQIQPSQAGFSSLKRNERKYVPATIRVGTNYYTNVAIRLKGGPGSFRPLDDKPAFTLNFDKFSPNQRFYGLKKIHLNNSVQDPTFLSEKIARQLFDAAGVPAPQAGNAMVEFGGRKLGMYVLVEGINKQFLKRYFKDVTGNVYDGHSQEDVTNLQRVNSGDNPRDHTRLHALAAAVQEPDLALRLKKLRETLDLDRFYSFIGMEIMLGHWDGYAKNRNNFRVYHDKDTDRMVFIPQGLDQLLRQTDASILPPMAGMVARSVFEIPECRAQYREKVAQLLTNVFKVGVVTNEIARAAARIEARLMERDPAGAAGHQQLAADFSRRFERRVAALDRSLSHPAKAAEFSQTGTVSLTNWWQQTDLGIPRLSQGSTEQGQPMLQIDLQQKGAASWRTDVSLPEGQYRFIARIKTEGVALDSSDQRSGCGLRISRRTFNRKLSGDNEWTTVVYDFAIQPPTSDVQFVCELRALRGRMSIDTGSLKLIRK